MSGFCTGTISERRNDTWYKTYLCFLKNSAHIDGVVQARCNSSALAMELHLSCTNPPIYGYISLTAPYKKHISSFHRWDHSAHPELCMQSSFVDFLCRMILSRVREWVVKFNSLSWTADSKVHVVYISCVIISRVSVPNFLEPGATASPIVLIKTHLPLVPHICINELGRYWLR